MNYVFKHGPLSKYVSFKSVFAYVVKENTISTSFAVLFFSLVPSVPLCCCPGVCKRKQPFDSLFTALVMMLPPMFFLSFHQSCSLQQSIYNSFHGHVTHALSIQRVFSFFSCLCISIRKSLA
jgi:hypothetical protein